jgi:hypothetical protein
MNTDNHRSVRLHFVFIGWGDVRRMGYDGHVPIVLIHLSLASCAVAEDSRSRYVACETSICYQGSVVSGAVDVGSM